VEVFPAHLEGSCGKGMCGRSSSTRGFEQRYNPVLQLSRAQFEQAVSELSVRPPNMTAIPAMNQGVADYPWVATTPLVEAVPEITVAAPPAWQQKHQPFILDGREPVEYQAGHLPGAVLLPPADLAVRLAEIPRERKVLVVCAAGARARRAAGFLFGCGFPQVTSLAGDTNGWRAAGLPPSRARSPRTNARRAPGAGPPRSRRCPRRERSVR
jgi:rhodanese-related sulfurtransferase